MSAVQNSLISRSGEVLSRKQSWELRLTRHEIEQLQRERDHLDSKAFERPLTRWERIRQRQIFRDLTSLFKRLGDYSEFEDLL